MGGGGNDFLQAGRGVDRVNGGIGNDVIFVQSDIAADTVVCGDGADTVYANGGDVVNEDCETIVVLPGG